MHEQEDDLNPIGHATAAQFGPGEIEGSEARSGDQAEGQEEAEPAHELGRVNAQIRIGLAILHPAYSCGGILSHNVGCPADTDRGAFHEGQKHQTHDDGGWEPDRRRPKVAAQVHCPYEERHHTWPVMNIVRTAGSRPTGTWHLVHGRARRGSEPSGSS
jgi:hypothetical protein